jgi:hypothetical protein
MLAKETKKRPEFIAKTHTHTRKRTRQQRAALADERVVPVGQPLDELVRVGRAGGRADLGHAALAVPPVRDVVGDGTRK